MILSKMITFVFEENEETELMLPNYKKWMQQRKVKAITELCRMFSSHLFNPNQRLYSLNHFGLNGLEYEP